MIRYGLIILDQNLMTQDVLTGKEQSAWLKVNQDMLQKSTK